MRRELALIAHARLERRTLRISDRSTIANCVIDLKKITRAKALGRQVIAHEGGGVEGACGLKLQGNRPFRRHGEREVVLAG